MKNKTNVLGCFFVTDDNIKEEIMEECYNAAQEVFALITLEKEQANESHYRNNQH